MQARRKPVRSSLSGISSTASILLMGMMCVFLGGSDCDMSSVPINITIGTDPSHPGSDGSGTYEPGPPLPHDQYDEPQYPDGSDGPVTGEDPYDPGDGDGGGGMPPGGGVRRFAVLKSTDGGSTWSDLGTTIFAFSSTPITGADPAPIIQDGQLVLYFADNTAIDQFFAGEEGITTAIYRAVATDPITFGEPTAIVSTDEYAMTDPAALQLADGSYRVFISHGGWVHSASSSDGVTYTMDDGQRSEVGGVPGVVALADGTYRLFVCDSSQGIISLLSEDGLNFEQEEGVRIPLRSEDEFVGGPHPIRLSSGSYIMTFKRVPAGGSSPNDDMIYIATSTDGYEWTAQETALTSGSVPSIVEQADGSLLIYYLDFSAVSTTGG